MEEKTEETLPTGFLFMHDTPRVCRCLYCPAKPVRLIRAVVQVEGSSPISIDASSLKTEGPTVCEFVSLAPLLRLQSLFVGTMLLASELCLDDFNESSENIFNGVSVYPGCDVTLALELENELKPGESVLVQPIYTISMIR